MVRLCRVILIALILLLPAACTFPQDPHRTTERTNEGTMYVGIVENPPWVTRDGDRPSGIEVALVSAYADTLGAQIEWKWGSSEEHLAALEYNELDLVIAGLTSATPWKTRIALTAPYYTVEHRVAVPPGMEPPRTLDEELLVAVERGSALVHELASKGATPLPVDDVKSVAGPVVLADWKIAQQGYVPTNLVIREDKHVIAIPPGENRWLLRLEDFLQGYKNEVREELVQNNP